MSHNQCSNQSCSCPFAVIFLVGACIGSIEGQVAPHKGHHSLNCTQPAANATKHVESFSCSRNNGSYSLTLMSNDTNGIFIHFKTLTLSEGDDFILKLATNVTVLHLTGAQHVTDLDYYIASPVVNFVANLSDKDKKQRNFIGDFYTGCTANVSGGSFSFPKYLVDNKTITCNFTIMDHGSKESVPYVSFAEFNLAETSSVAVDGLGGDFKVAPVFHGKTVPEFDIIGSGVTLSATLDTSVADQSATILVSYVNKACSGMKVLTTQSPQHQLTLPDNRDDLLLTEVECRWVFVGQDNTVLGLDVMNVSFTGVQDVLTATNGGRRNSPLAAQASQSDAWRVKGWHKHVYHRTVLSPLVSSFDCDKETASLYEQGGHYTSNGTFEIKPTGDSSFLLEVEEGKLVWLEAPLTKLKSGSVEVRSDFYTDSPLLETFPAGMLGYGVVSTGNKMLIQAKGFSTGDSFPVKFTGVLPGCHLTTLGASGFYSLAGNCNANCSWVVKPPSASGAGKFTLMLDHLNLAANDTLTVRKLTELAKPLLAVNGSALPPVELDSKDGALLQVHRGACTHGNGTLVSASVSPVLGKTGVNMTPELELCRPYYLQSPRFPNQYPLNSNRSWTFEGKGVGGLVLSFFSLDLKAGHTLNLTSSNQTVVLRGDEIPNDFALDNPKLTVRFSSPVTAGYESGYGFNATLLPVEMARMVAQEKGVVETPSYPSPVKNNSVYFWSVTVLNPDKSKFAVAVQFNISLGKNASVTAQDLTESLTVYDGKNSFHSPVFANLTGKDLLSKTDVILVKYVVPASMSLGTPLRINFTTYVCNLTDTCKNTGICIHADWRCNGVNDCGDNSDELSCSYVPTPSPPPAPTTPPTPAPAKGGVSPAAFAVTVLIALALGAAAALSVPVLVRRYRAYRYSRFSNVAVSE
ncbi:unnamed protein product [Ixodes hexagonus]